MDLERPWHHGQAIQQIFQRWTTLALATEQGRDLARAISAVNIQTCNAPMLQNQTSRHVHAVGAVHRLGWPRLPREGKTATS